MIREVNVKVKVHFSLEQATMAQRGRGGQICSSTLPSTSALDGGGWLTPRPGRFSQG